MNIGDAQMRYEHCNRAWDCHVDADPLYSIG